ncbi:MAG: hypothetical protein ABIP21_09905, partial [Acidimicrobiia bacterium]
PVTVAAVEAALGGAPFEMRMAILDAVAAEDVAGVLTAVAELLEAAHDPRRIAEGLLGALRDAFILVASGGRVSLDDTEEQQARLRAVGEALGNAHLVRALETLGQAVVDMRGTDAADPRLVLEIALVRLARRESNSALATLADRVDRLETRLAQGGGVPSVDQPRVASAPRPAPAPDAPRAAPPKAKPPKRSEPVAASDTPAPVEAAGNPEARAPRAKPAALGALRKAAAAAKTGSAQDPAEAAAGEPAAPEPPPAAVDFELDDAIVAWAKVLADLPKALATAIMEAQPVRVDGNVIVFGVARSHIDTVKPRFQKDADAIRQAFIHELGGPPRFSFTPHEWGDGEGPPHRQARNEPEPEPPPELEDIVDIGDPSELEDAPMSEGPAVDSLSRLADTFGATVVEEQPKS